MSTTDSLTNILLYLNKANIQKAFVELITLSPMSFRPEEEHMRKILAHVTEHNYLFTNEMNIATTPNKISFAIKSGKKLLKYWDIVVDYDPFAEEIKKEENLASKSFRTEKNVIKEEDELNAAGRDLYTNSNLNLTSNNKNQNSKNENNEEDVDNNNENSRLNINNNFENFNNNENSRIKTGENKGENSQNYNEELENVNEKEDVENEAQMDAIDALGDGSKEKQMKNNSNEESNYIDNNLTSKKI